MKQTNEYNETENKLTHVENKLVVNSAEREDRRRKIGVGY